MQGLVLICEKLMSLDFKSTKDYARGESKEAWKLLGPRRVDSTPISPPRSGIAHQSHDVESAVDFNRQPSARLGLLFWHSLVTPPSIGEGAKPEKTTERILFELPRWFVTVTGIVSLLSLRMIINQHRVAAPHSSIPQHPCPLWCGLIAFFISIEVLSTSSIAASKGVGRILGSSTWRNWVFA